MKPQRMCVVCREMREKEQLFRVVKNKDGGVFADATFKAQGRGAYVCKSAECIAEAQKRRAFERSFSMRVDSEIYNALEAMLDNAK